MNKDPNFTFFSQERFPYLSVRRRPKPQAPINTIKTRPLSKWIFHGTLVPLSSWAPVLPGVEEASFVFLTTVEVSRESGWMKSDSGLLGEQLDTIPGLDKQDDAKLGLEAGQTCPPGRG